MIKNSIFHFPKYQFSKKDLFINCSNKFISFNNIKNNNSNKNNSNILNYVDSNRILFIQKKNIFGFFTKKNSNENIIDNEKLINDKEKKGILLSNIF